MPDFGEGFNRSDAMLLSIPDSHAPLDESADRSVLASVLQSALLQCYRLFGAHAFLIRFMG